MKIRRFIPVIMAAAVITTTITVTLPESAQASGCGYQSVYDGTDFRTHKPVYAGQLGGCSGVRTVNGTKRAYAWTTFSNDWAGFTWISTEVHTASGTGFAEGFIGGQPTAYANVGADLGGTHTIWGPLTGSRTLRT